MQFSYSTSLQFWRPPLMLSSLDDFRALFVQELVAAIGTEQLDLLASKFLVVTIELAFTLRAGHPENFRHGSVPRIFSRQGAKFRGSRRPRNSGLPPRLCVFAGVISFSLDLGYSLQQGTGDKILKPGFLHRRFRHRNARFVGTLDRLGGVDVTLDGTYLGRLWWI